MSKPKRDPATAACPMGCPVDAPSGGVCPQCGVSIPADAKRDHKTDGFAERTLGHVRTDGSVSKAGMA